MKILEKIKLIAYMKKVAMYLTCLSEKAVLFLLALHTCLSFCIFFTDEGLLADTSVLAGLISELLNDSLLRVAGLDELIEFNDGEGVKAECLTWFAALSGVIIESERMARLDLRGVTNTVCINVGEVVNEWLSDSLVGARFTNELSARSVDLGGVTKG